MENLVYLILGFLSFFFVIVPAPGSFVINSLLVLVVDVHVAISVGAFFFFVNSTIKAFVFRQNILLKYVKGILPISILGSVAGAMFVAYIPEKLLLVIVFTLSVYFLIKSATNIFVKKESKNSTNQILLWTMSLISGFMQGTGLGGGGGLRKQYLLAERVSLAEMHGTTSLISAAILLASVVTRLSTDQVELIQLMPVIYLIPIMVVATILGRTVLKKVDKNIADMLIFIIMMAVTITFGYQFMF